jgi:hypothetical protein
MKSSKYLNQFFARKSWKDIVQYMPHKLNLKEITEVMAVWRVARKYVDEVGGIVDCGSGKWSSMGVLAAFSCKTDIYSVDPREDLIVHKDIKNHKCINKKLCDVIINKVCPVMLLSCHGHQTLSETKNFLDHFPQWIYITMPCCVDNRIPNRVGEVLVDQYVWSDKNTIYTYRSGL